MGNAYLNHERKVSIPSLFGEWVPAGKTEYCQLTKNTRTGIIAELYHIPLDPRVTPQQNLEIYEQRRIQNDNLVVVYHVEKETNQYLCQGKEFLIVKTQRIPYRLSEMNNLSFAESLYILKEAMVGFGAITDFYGAISITDEMIGFTNDHRVKVWLNEQFAHNLPRESINFLMKQPMQIEQKLPNTITQLFSVVEQHCENGQFPEPFSKAYRQYPIQTFSEAVQFIQDYAFKKGINLRNSLSSNSKISAKTDYSLKQTKDRRLSTTPPPKPITTPLTNHPAQTSTTPLTFSSHSPVIHKVAQPAKIVNDIEPRKYYMPEVRQPERKLITIADKHQNHKHEFESKPSSNFTSTVSSNSNTFNTTRKISQTNNQPTYKLFSPREPKLTFAPNTGLKIPNHSHKTTPSQVHYGETHNNRVVSNPPYTKPHGEATRYSAHQGAQGHISTPAPTVKFNDLNKFWSPNKGVSKQRRVNERLVTDTEGAKNGMTRYERYAGDAASTVPRNIKVETIPKTISFNYSKGLKPSKN